MTLTHRLNIHPRYDVIRPLGAGGFGTVFEALDRQTGRRMAVKELVRANADALARFKQEFRALQGVHHPNLVEVRELLENEGRWFIVMELVEGEDFLRWVRPGAIPASDNDNDNDGGRADSDGPASFDEARLRSTLRDMALGLTALHEHGIVHRDLKPSNVRVTKAGRAVLLDFGLITALDPRAQSTHAGFVGTAAYMAPEQASDAPVGPEADWYAFGSCLYEALTGQLPFDGSHALQVLLLKQGAPPPAPSTLTETLPRDLDALCVQLLRTDPTQRACGREVLNVLRPDADASNPLEPALTASFAVSPFAGRESELEQLERAFERTQRGELGILLVEGESGVGKSALVGEFLRLHRERHPDTLVLKGRCYENEQIPYKAFDGCIDGLAKVLKRMSSEQCALLLPQRAAVLGQLFPVLREVQAIARAPLKGVSADPTARRLEGFAALAGLFGKLAESRPVIIAVDDLQWADAESFRMLRALLEDRDRPSVFFLYTVRPRNELDGATLAELDLVRSWHCANVLALQGLPRAQARTLATRLLGADAPREWVQVIVDESKGHPLFISALAQYAASHEMGSASSLTLEAALGARIRALPAQAHTLLELIALSGRPYREDLFATALGRPPDFGDLLKLLRSQRLARGRGKDEVVCFHDSIRHVIVASIGSTRLPALHRKLAQCLEGDANSDASERARHWEAARETERAIESYASAADEALDTLAFLHAERLYLRALELLSDKQDPRRHRLLVQRGHALARGARSAEAAIAFQEAAESADGETKVRLRVWAAQHMIQGAQIQEGMRTARALLADLGVSLADGQASALAQLAWQRTCISVRGIDFEMRPNHEIAAAERLLLDALADLALAVGWVDLIAGASLNALHLRRALAAGDRGHLSRALSQEGTVRAMQRPQKPALTEARWQQARDLANACGDPGRVAYQALMEGTGHLFTCDFQKALVCLEQAQSRLKAECPGEPWLLTNVRVSLGAVCFYTSQHARLMEDADVWLAEAKERHDRFAQTALLGLGTGYVRHLMRDQPELALSELQASMGAWPNESFSMAHMGELIALAPTELYRGGDGLRTWLLKNETRLDRAFALKTALGQELLHMYRALSLLASTTVQDEHELAARLHRVVRHARSLQKLKRRTALPLGLLIEAQVAVLQKDLKRALTLVRNARKAFAEIGVLYEHPASYLEGLLEGGESGKQRCATATEAVRAEGWKDPLRALTIFVPILRTLALQTDDDAASGALIHGRYDVLDALGEGGFGNVVEAKDVRTARRVALKELVRSSPSALLRFKHEFRALQNVFHPNLIRLEALFEHQGAWFIAMELVRGENFLQWVRPSNATVCDQARLREALRGLVHGLSALHDAGFLHRDLKPENVLVTPEGRVVLMDFGLITSLSSALDTDQVALGTAAYMAPEQGEGLELDPASDVYALGVCLYQALTGKLPFSAETPIEVMRMKRTLAPPDPFKASRGAAFELSRLCLSLLAINPRERPSLRAVLDILDGSWVGTIGLPYPAREGMGAASGPPFAGRVAELDALQKVFARTQREHAPQIVLVEGASGVGKTAVVTELTTRLRAEPTQAWVLRSRCHENEQVPYKAFDGAIDELAKALRKLPRAALERVIPPRAALLAQLFPVLGSVHAIAQAPLRAIPADPTARRLAGFEALRALLTNVCAQAPIVIVVDDLQWSDAESFRMLRALTEGENAPGLLILCTVRPPHELDPAIAAQLETARQWRCLSTLVLEGLPPDEAQELAKKLLSAQVPAERVQAIARESKGHPLFIAELSQFMSTHRDPALSETVSLESALAVRIRGLPERARRLLFLVALIDRPCGAHVFARALELNDEINETANALLAAHLIRVRKDQQLECFHDRIRLVALSQLSPEDTSLLQGCLARALDGEAHAEAAERAQLWESAGEPMRALDAYQEAAEAALESLAFLRAERLYERALGLLAGSDPARDAALRTQRAHALARAGRTGDAALAYNEAAQRAEGEQRIRLRMWEAQQLLQGTHFEQGLRTTRSIFQELGVAMPAGNTAALAQIGWDRALIRLRGLDVDATSTSNGVTDKRLALDALLQLSMPVSWVEFFTGIALNARHLRLALALGEPSHVARALAQEAAARAVQDPQDAGDVSLLARSRALVEGENQPVVEAFQTLMEGTAAFFRMDYLDARRQLESAQEQLQTRCPGEPWLLTNSRITLGATLGHLGEYLELRTQSESWLAEAREREDRFAVGVLSGLAHGYVSYLMNDAPEHGLAQVQMALDPWPREPFSMVHYGELAAAVSLLIYRGGDGAFRWLQEHDGALDAAFLMKTRGAAEHLATLRGRAMLRMLSDTAKPQQPRILDLARRQARKLQSLRTPLAPTIANLHFAQIDALVGEPERALKRTRAAYEGFGARQSVLQHSASYLEGLIEGGEAGAEKRRATLRFFSDQGWTDPMRGLATYGLSGVTALHDRYGL